MVKSLCPNARILKLFALVSRYISAMLIHVAFSYTQFSIVFVCVFAWYLSYCFQSMIFEGVSESAFGSFRWRHGLWRRLRGGVEIGTSVPGIVFVSSPTRPPPCSSIGRRSYSLPSLPPTSPYYKLRGCQAPGSMLNCISGYRLQLISFFTYVCLMSSNQFVTSYKRKQSQWRFMYSDLPTCALFSAGFDCHSCIGCYDYSFLFIYGLLNFRQFNRLYLILTDFFDIHRIDAVFQF